MRWIPGLILFVITAIVVHYLVLTSIPGLIMGRVSSSLEAQGVPMYGWVASPRQTPETQEVVRPSPDLAYAICRFNTKDGPVLITAPTSAGYGSVSIFNEQTDNIFIGDLSAGSEFTGVFVHRKRNPPVGTGAGYAKNDRANVSMEGKGLALIRRLAPDLESHDRASALIENSVCEQVILR